VLKQRITAGRKYGTGARGDNMRLVPDSVGIALKSPNRQDRSMVHFLIEAVRELPVPNSSALLFGSAAFPSVKRGQGVCN